MYDVLGAISWPLEQQGCDMFMYSDQLENFSWIANIQELLHQRIDLVVNKMGAYFGDQGSNSIRDKKNAR